MNVDTFTYILEQKYVQDFDEVPSCIQESQNKINFVSNSSQLEKSQNSIPFKMSVRDILKYRKTLKSNYQQLSGSRNALFECLLTAH